MSSANPTSNPTGNSTDAMLELFQAEVLKHTETIAQSLPSLADRNQRGGLLNNHIRSFHSIRGAARIVGLHPFAELAHSLEDWFYDILQGQNDFGDEGLACLRDILEIWERIRNQAAVTLPAWTESSHELFAEKTVQVRELIGLRKTAPGGTGSASAKTGSPSPRASTNAGSAPEQDPPQAAPPTTHSAESAGDKSAPTAEPAPPTGGPNVVPAVAKYLGRHAEAAKQAQDPVLRLGMHAFNRRGIAATRDLFFHVFDGVPRPVVLDLEAVGDIEADGIALLADFAKEVRERQWEKPRLKNVGAGTSLLLQMTRLHLQFQWTVRGDHGGT